MSAPDGPPDAWTPPEVAAFLRSLHLPEELANDFLSNAVSGKELVELSDDELRDHLSMKPLQIKKLRSELQQLGVAPPAAAAAEAPSLPPAPAAAAAAPGQVQLTLVGGATVPVMLVAAAPAASAAPAAAPAPRAPLTASEPDPASCFERADLVRYNQLQETIAQLQAMQVSSKLAEAQGYAGRAQQSRVAAQGAVPRTRAELAAREKEASKYAAGGGACGCLFKGRAERKHGEAEAAVGRLKQQLEEQGSVAAAAEVQAQEAQSQLAAWQGKSAELASATASLEQLTGRMFAAPAWRASPRLNAVSDALRALETQAAEAGRHADSFGRGTQLLQRAARGLQEALQALSRTQVVGAVNMGRGVAFQRRTGRGARRQPGRQMGNLVEMAVFRRANDGIAQAARDTAEASTVLGPGMPRVDASVLSSARAGMLQNIVFGGVISDAIQMATVRRSIEATKQLLGQVQACLSWAQQNLGAHQQRSASLASQVAGKKGELRDFKQQALMAASMAATAPPGGS